MHIVPDVPSSSQRQSTGSRTAWRLLPFLPFALMLAACGGTADDAATAGTATDAAPGKAGEVTGLATPESALHDATRDVWYIANINGGPGEKDNNGFITRVSGDLAVVDTQFIAGGAAGVTLHAPKGMALVGDTLWVSDIDAVRGFDVTTGAAVATVEVAGAVFLNDVAATADGVVYISDSGIRFGPDGRAHPGPDRVFRMTGRAAEEALRFETGTGPNGLLYDDARGRLLIVAFTARTLFEWTPGAATADSTGSGPGVHDGVARLADGRVLVSSWADSTVHVLADGRLTPLIRNVPAPADIGVDAGRGHVAVPLFELGRVEFWRVGAP